MSKPATYKEQPGCHNCDHAFLLYEYDDPTRYFCHADKSKRPNCGSVAMDETCSDPFSGVSDKEYTKMSEDAKNQIRELGYQSRRKHDQLWDVWANPRRVCAWGLCDEWIIRIYDEDGEG